MAKHLRSHVVNLGCVSLSLGLMLGGCSSRTDDASSNGEAGQSGSTPGTSATAGRDSFGGRSAGGNAVGGSSTPGSSGSGGSSFAAGSTEGVSRGGSTSSGAASGAAGRMNGLGGSTAAAGKSATGAVSSIGGKASNGGSSVGGKAATGGASGSVGGKAATGGTSGGVGGKAATGGAVGNAGTVSIGTPNVTIDRSQELQTIDGFGIFGARDVWWGNAADLWSDEWGTLVLTDLGITIWRNEYSSEETLQDANWAKQRPVVAGIKRIADANRIPLKYMLTVWSPPASMKCTVASVQAGQQPCTPHPGGTKNGGALDPSKYDAYAQWLAQGVKNYADLGIDLYAMSPQNEPMFVEPYNSCVYDVDPAKLNSYARMVSAVGPALKRIYPDVRMVGTENMLGLEGQQWFYSPNMTVSGWAAMDILAYHGYQDGVAPTDGSQLATYWKFVRESWAAPRGKRSWMTETSGYIDTWGATDGAKALAFAIYAALSYGQASAWVWWQGSELGGPPGQYALMGGTQYLGKRYYVSKQFYRYIRPGAKMVAVTSTDPNLFVVAFSHAAMGAFTVVAINNAAQDKSLILGGAMVPATFNGYRTSATEDCTSIGSVTNGSIVLKADSITTLVNGNFVE